ncbi:MAG: sensor histidine kinase [Bacillota bacterium]
MRLAPYLYAGGVLAPVVIFFFFPWSPGIFAAYLCCALGIILWISFRIRNEYGIVENFVRELSSGDFDAVLEMEKLRVLAGLGRKLLEIQSNTTQRLGDTRRRRKEIEAILTSMVEGVVALDQSGKVILFNPVAGEILGLSPPEILGKRHSEMFPYDFSELFQEVLVTGEAKNAEIVMERNGEHLLMVHASPIKRGESDVLGVVSVLEDVTELRRLERLRTEFVANVSHELKTPLTSIKGFVETLLEEQEDPQLRERFLKIINKEANRLSFLIDDLLELSRLEAKDTRLELGPVNITRVSRHVLAVLEGRFIEKKLQVQNKLPEELMVLGVRELLQEVFVNFLDNAIKYTPEHGRITIGHEFLNERELKILISDTGVGIPPESLNRLYERFYRVDKARSREVGGTGLGLSIVKHIIEKHGGIVGVESELGKGSTFYFTLQRGDLPDLNDERKTG